ncbi:hypothetical protein OK349_07905 [Sphingomonas sp. BT-65]|uniref:hypothetical protein n=1 Tax=Sphingomonas sp. BT-65 TaxID=2989821 RepID=UPI0022361E58|nr:hypothetical protein [Sphingomonas sp. BT-65]MCW4461629.1 hypothetical protein [Sphingomonas sp. BT-65]
MDEQMLPIWAFAAGLGWLVLVSGASVVYRKSNGKPIRPRLPPDALFAERFASSTWANNCLMVSVTSEALEVTPFFPFTLGFLPEIYRLDHRIPVRSIHSVALLDTGWVNNVVIRHGPDERSLKLKLRNPAALVQALSRLGVRALPR